MWTQVGQILRNVETRERYDIDIFQLQAVTLTLLSLCLDLSAGEVQRDAEPPYCPATWLDAREVSQFQHQHHYDHDDENEDDDDDNDDHDDNNNEDIDDDDIDNDDYDDNDDNIDDDDDNDDDNDYDNDEDDDDDAGTNSGRSVSVVFSSMGRSR